MIVRANGATSSRNNQHKAERTRAQELQIARHYCFGGTGGFLPRSPLPICPLLPCPDGFLPLPLCPPGWFCGISFTLTCCPSSSESGGFTTIQSPGCRPCKTSSDVP